MKEKDSQSLQLLEQNYGPPKRLDDLSSEQRERITTIQDFKRRGLTNAAIARLLNCGEATVYRDLKLIREIYIARGSNIVITEEVGRGIELYDEIMDKAMDGYRTVMEDSGNDDEKKIPDHGQANRYLMTALSATKQKMDLLIEIGMAQMMGQALEKRIRDDGAIDVSKLRTKGELEAARKTIRDQIIENEREIHRIRGPRYSDFENPADYEAAVVAHNRRYEEYLETKKQFDFDKT